MRSTITLLTDVMLPIFPGFCATFSASVARVNDNLPWSQNYMTNLKNIISGLTKKFQVVHCIKFANKFRLPHYIEVIDKFKEPD